MTTLIVHSQPDDSPGDVIVGQIRGIAENVIRLDLKRHEGRNCIAIRAERSATSTHDRDVYELRQDPMEAIDPHLIVVNTFDLATDIRKENPSVASVNILLDAGTRLQTAYCRQIQSHYKQMGAYSVAVRDHRNTFLRRSTPEHAIKLQDALWIVLRQGHTTPRDPQSLFAPLWSSRPDWLRTISIKLAPREEEKRGGQSEQQPVFGLPYFLNPSFLAVRQDFLDFITQSGNAAWQAIEAAPRPPEKTYSWKTLIEAAKEFQKTRGYLTLFDFPVETPETLNCLFLEIVCSLSDPPGARLDRSDFVENFSERSAAYSHIVSAILTPRQLLHDRWNTYPPSGPWPPARNSESAPVGSGASKCDLSPRSIFSRHWYSTYRQVLADLKDGPAADEPRLRLARLPNRIWANGDWLFSVLNGSVGVETGVHIILDQFLDGLHAENLMAQGVGLPPFRHFYDRTGVLPITGVAPVWFKPYLEGNCGDFVIERSSLTGYNDVALILSSHLSGMLSFESSDDSAEEAEVRDKIRSFHDLARRYRSPV